MFYPLILIAFRINFEDLFYPLSIPHSFPNKLRGWFSIRVIYSENYGFTNKYITNILLSPAKIKYLSQYLNNYIW